MPNGLCDDRGAIARRERGLAINHCRTQLANNAAFGQNRSLCLNKRFYAVNFNADPIWNAVEPSLGSLQIVHVKARLDKGQYQDRYQVSPLIIDTLLKIE